MGGKQSKEAYRSSYDGSYADGMRKNQRGTGSPWDIDGKQKPNPKPTGNE